MLPLASTKRAARKVAFKCDLGTDTPKTVRCSEVQPGQKLIGTLSTWRNGERCEPTAAEKRMYLMPWGDTLIGIDPGTKRRLEYSVALAWEYDHWLIRSIRTLVDAEPLVGSIGRHPLPPPHTHIHTRLWLY